MKNPKLASRYAQALYDFSIESDNLEIVYHDILMIQEILIMNRELKTVLENPIIPQTKKQNIIKEIFQPKLCETTFRFFVLVAKKRREPELLMICRQFIKIYYRNHNIKEAHVTSAFQLSNEMTHYLQTFLEDNSPYKYVISFDVDPDIIGGLVVKIDDYCFDATIQAKINKLKTQFSQNTYAAGF